MASGSDGDDGDGGNSASDGDSGTDENESASEAGSSEDTDGYESASDNEDGDAESDDSDFEPGGERGGGGVKRGGGTGAGQDKKKTAEKTGGRSGGNDYEEIDTVFDSDSEDDGCGPGSVDAKKKKKGNRVLAFRRVIQPRKAREESDKRQIASNLEISGKKDASVKERKNDLRGLTLRQSVCALYNVIHNETLDEEIVNKLEADDPALHEIRIGVQGTMLESKGMGKGKVVACHVDKKGNKAFTIDWEKDGAADRKYSASKVLDGAIGRVDPRVHDWVEGTTVESNGLGKGRVFGCGLDKAGYKEFIINWESDGVADSKFSTFQVLDGAMEGEAESIESTIEYMTNCLCLIVCAMNTHVKAYMDSQSKRDNEPLELKKGSVAHQRAQTVRPWAWKKMLELRAHETMSRESLRLRENFHGTAEGLRNAKLYDLFHFSDSASGVNGGQVGFMDPAHYDQDFNKKQVKDMNVIVQAFQSVIRVGRPVITESILFPLTRSELPPGTLIPNNETLLAKVCSLQNTSLR